MNSFSVCIPSPLQKLNDPLFDDFGVEVWIKRDDLIHPTLSGNKWRKLKYNLLTKGHDPSHPQEFLSFGGAYSNHIHAFAAAGLYLNVPTIGIIRGDELTPESSPTLRFCQKCNMQLHFVSRSEYREKENGATFKQLLSQYPDLVTIPEGGSNQLAIPGVKETVDETIEQLGQKPSYFITAVGSGGTTAGLLSGGVSVIGIPVLKNGMFLKEDIKMLLGIEQLVDESLILKCEYHFGGYGKYTQELIDFIHYFETKHQIQIEQVYTGKILYGMYDLIKTGYFAKGTVLVALHTGGLQGRINTLK